MLHWLTQLRLAQKFTLLGLLTLAMVAFPSALYLKQTITDVRQAHRQALIARGPRSPEPGAPYTYVTTPGFLVQFGLETLRDLPDFEKLEDAGLLSKDRLLAGELMPSFSGEEPVEREPDDDLREASVDED